MRISDWSSDVCSSDLVCLEVHTKLNTIDPEVFKIIGKALEIVANGYRALVVYNEGSHFSAGANLGLAMFAANVGPSPTIADIAGEAQKVDRALKRALFPAVAAPSALAPGGVRAPLLAPAALSGRAP